jgi:drug/metabolite transporter superfamily protein YnfA
MTDSYLRTSPTDSQLCRGAPRLGVGRRRHRSRSARGFVAAGQPDALFGRILAAYGGVFVAGSLAWEMVLDGFPPDRHDVAGSLMCLIGPAVIMYAPRSS